MQPSTGTWQILALWSWLLCRLAIGGPVAVAATGGLINHSEGAEPGSMVVDEAVVEHEETLSLLPGESMSGRIRREYTNNRAARRRVFKLTDLNGDGLVTRREYVIRNGNMTDEEFDILFGAFDVDGDRRLSQDEFVRHGFLWVVAQECELESIRRCDDEFVYLIQAADPTNGDNQQGMMCRALQTYFDCIEHEQVSCDMTSYSQAVVDLVATYRTVHFCPDLDFGGLLSMPGDDDDDDDDIDLDDELDNDHGDLEPSELLSSVQDQDTASGDIIEYRLKRSLHSGHPDSKHHRPKFPWWGGAFGPLLSGAGKDGESCASSALSSCTASFNEELRTTSREHFCTSLSDYRHCVTRQARRCRDYELLDIEKTLRMWLHLHQKLELC